MKKPRKELITKVPREVVEVGEDVGEEDTEGEEVDTGTRDAMASDTTIMKENPRTRTHTTTSTTMDKDQNPNESP